MVITPRVQSGNDVFLDVSIERYSDGAFEVVSEPRLLVRDREAAEVQITSEEGDTFKLQVTPMVNPERVDRT